MQQFDLIKCLYKADLSKKRESLPESYFVSDSKLRFENSFLSTIKHSSTRMPHLMPNAADQEATDVLGIITGALPKDSLSDCLNIPFPLPGNGQQTGYVKRDKISKRPRYVSVDKFSSSSGKSRKRVYAIAPMGLPQASRTATTETMPRSKVKHHAKCSILFH
jgi:hypothetical protein